MEKIRNHNLTERQLLKIPNHYYLQLNHHYYKEFTTQPQIVKVKGHSSNHWNNEAVELAKHAATLKSKIHHIHHCTDEHIHKVHITAPQTVLEKQNMRFIYRNENIIQNYPSKINTKIQLHQINPPR
jgi:hypothetical protein